MARLGLPAVLFSPLAFYLWDDYRFGWHSETIYYPLAIVFWGRWYAKTNGALALGPVYFLSREDGILLLWALYLAYTVASSPAPFLKTLKKLAPATLAALTPFLLGLGLFGLTLPRAKAAWPWLRIVF